MNAFLIVCAIVFAILAFASLSIYSLRKLKPENQTFIKVVVIVRLWWIIAGGLIRASGGERTVT